MCCMPDEPLRPDEVPDWEHGKNIPPDAVQYWGKCKGCNEEAFVSVAGHLCTVCFLKTPRANHIPVPVPKPEPDVGPWTDGPMTTEPEPPGIQKTLAEEIRELERTGDPAKAVKALGDLHEAAVEHVDRNGKWKKGRPKTPTKPRKAGKGKDKGGFTPRTKKTQIAPAKFDGPVGVWTFDEPRKSWVVRNDKGRVVKQSKDKPPEAGP